MSKISVNSSVNFMTVIGDAATQHSAVKERKQSALPEVKCTATRQNRGIIICMLH